MSSSGGDDGGLSSLLAMQAAQPMPGLPVAGKDSTIGDPYEYGKFQNFLPDIKAEGRNDNATGLRPEMFAYQKPVPGGGAGNTLRDTLAQTVASGGASSGGGGGPPAAPPATSPNLVPAGTSMFGRGPPSNGVGPPPGANALPVPQGGWAPGNVPGWPAGGPSNGMPTDWRSREGG